MNNSHKKPNRVNDSKKNLRGDNPEPTVMSSTSQLKDDVPEPTVMPSTSQLKDDVPEPTVMPSTSQLKDDVPEPTMGPSTSQLKDNVPEPSPDPTINLIQTISFIRDDVPQPAPIPLNSTEFKIEGLKMYEEKSVSTTTNNINNGLSEYYLLGSIGLIGAVMAGYFVRYKKRFLYTPIKDSLPVYNEYQL